tara:strand:+ start:13632 stop:14444 length:813 start_codon:yes stop_codon:yes gene_type:complete
MNKVDVVIQVYGKPWQTLCTLESLMTHCEEHIDKIYFIEEAKHPFDDKVKWVLKYFDNIVYYKPDKFVNIYGTWSKDVPVSNIRHQFGIENSDKKYVFICHNDVLFTGDIIGDMLNEIEDCVGIGEIGQCWNCPAKAQGLCSGEKFYDWNPTFEDLKQLKLPHIRTRLDNLDKEIPKLLPECRLNEFACLINREICIKEGRPYFGEFDHDSGTAWFKSMYKKGYKFKDYRKNFQHCYWNELGGGHTLDNNENAYFKAERKAKQYFKKNYE